MPGPLIFFGIASVASLLARDEDDELERERRLGLSRRSSRGARKPYVFETDCIHSDGDSINKMKHQARQISYETMLKYCDLPGWARQHGYDERSPGVTLRHDPYVGYYKSFYQGRPAYYLVWSGIEQIFVER